MFVMAAELRVAPDRVDEFLALIERQARTSLEQEAGCHQFDVCQSEEDPAQVLLYEVYDDAAAFDVHVETERFKTFFEQVGPMLVAEPALRRFRRTFANRD